MVCRLFWAMSSRTVSNSSSMDSGDNKGWFWNRVPPKSKTPKPEIQLPEPDKQLKLVSSDEIDEEKIKEVSHEIKNGLSILDIYLKLIEKDLGKDNKNLAVNLNRKPDIRTIFFKAYSFVKICKYDK